jgi:hypothetical protein
MPSTGPRASAAQVGLSRGGGGMNLDTAPSARSIELTLVQTAANARVGTAAGKRQRGLKRERVVGGHLRGFQSNGELARGLSVDSIPGGQGEWRGMSVRFDSHSPSRLPPEMVSRVSSFLIYLAC